MHIEDCIQLAQTFFATWLQQQAFFSDEEKEDAACFIAWDEQVALPYHHADLDVLLEQHPDWAESEAETDDVYTHIQHNAGEHIFAALLDTIQAEPLAL